MEHGGAGFCCSLYQGKAVYIFCPFHPSVLVPALHPGLLLFSSAGAKEQLWGWQAAWPPRRATLAAALLVCR